MASRVLSVIIAGDAKGAVKAFRDTDKASKGTGSKIGTLGKIAAAGFAGAAAGAVAFGVASIGAASDYDDAHQQLLVALKNTKTSWDAQKQAIDDVETSSRKLGFTDTDVESALAVMTRGMGSAKTATKYLGVAQDLARAKNIDLSAAALAVTKGFEGQLKPLKALGIDLPIAAAGALKVKKAHDALIVANTNLVTVMGKIHDGLLKGPAASAAYSLAAAGVQKAQKAVNDTTSAGTLIVEGLSQKLHGSAAAASDTYKGKQRELKAELDHVQVEIGQKLMPALIGVETWIAKDGIPAMTAFGTAILGVGTAIGNAVSDIHQWTINVGGFFSDLSGKLNTASDAISNALGQGNGGYKINANGTVSIPGTTAVVGKDGKVFDPALLVNSNKSSPHFTPAPSKGRAKGGPVRAGQTYMVGEHGPEPLVMGNQNGAVYPTNWKPGSGGGGDTFNITVNAIDARGVEAVVVDALKNYAKRNQKTPWGTSVGRAA